MHHLPSATSRDLLTGKMIISSRRRMGCAPEWRPHGCLVFGRRLRRRSRSSTIARSCLVRDNGLAHSRASTCLIASSPPHTSNARTAYSSYPVTKATTASGLSVSSARLPAVQLRICDPACEIGPLLFDEFDSSAPVDAHQIRRHQTNVARAIGPAGFVIGTYGAHSGTIGTLSSLTAPVAGTHRRSHAHPQSDSHFNRGAGSDVLGLQRGLAAIYPAICVNTG